ncbi:MAG: DUF5684 domain-containing protein [Pseudolysinimonas sp.]
MDNNPNAYLPLAILIYAISIGIVFVVLVGFYVLMAVALSKFFAKVGVEPWIAWVPIYGYWKWLEVGGQAGALSLLFLVPYANVVASVFLYIGMYRTGIAFRKDGAFLVLGIFLPFVWAFMLASETEVYRPELITQAGFPPPLAGYGSAAGPATAAAPPAA